MSQIIAPATPDDIYRIGGPTHARWLADYERAHEQLRRWTFTDDEGMSWIDPENAPGPVVKLYCDLQSLGYWHGWMSKPDSDPTTEGESA